MITRRIRTGDAIYPHLAVEELHAVDILVAPCEITICHIHKPPLEAVHTPHYVRLSRSEKNILGKSVLEVEKRHIEVARMSASSSVHGKHVFAISQCCSLLLSEIHYAIVSSFFIVDYHAVEQNAGVAIVSHSQCHISGFHISKERLAKP